MAGLVNFLKGEGQDGAGRRLDDVLAFDDAQLESRHDFIQWLFPLPEQSAAVPEAPVLTEVDVAALRGDPAARANLGRAAARMLEFYERTPAWTRRSDHNHLRITRIIRSLRLLVGDEEADQFREGVLRLAATRRADINPTSLGYWRRA